MWREQIIKDKMKKSEKGPNGEKNWDHRTIQYIYIYIYIYPTPPYKRT